MVKRKRRSSNYNTQRLLIIIIVIIAVIAILTLIIRSLTPSQSPQLSPSQSPQLSPSQTPSYSSPTPTTSSADPCQSTCTGEGEEQVNSVLKEVECRSNAETKAITNCAKSVCDTNKDGKFKGNAIDNKFETTFKKIGNRNYECKSKATSNCVICTAN